MTRKAKPVEGDYPWNVPTDADETTHGPRVRSEVSITPDTAMGLFDFGSGVHLVIGFVHGANVVFGLGFDEATRRDACDRLIAALTEARAWTPQVAP